ncbi:phage tail tape measure protein [Nakamurella panacisegetis]|uniref:phage tail tape measure protein n=1 Tax=Nakamurella panacisegetis TaxID=1090615 RepID=UPI001E2D3909|nr:phage tail tape measure protein [Nakamurella panacisegetis]
MNAQAYVAGVRQAAEATKSIATAAVEARTRIAGIGAEATQVASRLTGLGNTGGTALRGLVTESNRVAAAFRGLGSGNPFGTLATDIRNIGSTLAAQLAHVHALHAGLGALAFPPGGLAGTAAMQNQIRDLEAQIRALRAAAGAPIPIGPTPHSPAPAGGSSGSSGSSALSSASLARLASYAAGYLAIGSAIKSTYKQTADFETEINTLGAVTQTSGAKLQTVADKAMALGADASIAGASASDAAVAMTELAKGGLSVADSMTAAKGTLQLASAGSVSFTQAAQIQTSAMAAFSLGADQAQNVADTLANTANAARGSIADFATGLTYAGATAHLVGWNLTDTSATLALFAKNGLTGSVGGSTLNTMLLNMLHVSKPAAAAIKALGIQTYDASGHFISAAKLTDQLSAAQKRMTPEAFNAAIAVLGGNRAVRGLADVAKEGTPGLTKMTAAITGGAGAAAFSEARMKGLGGAFSNLQNQIETAQVTLGEKWSPTLQKAANLAASAVPKITGFLTGSALGGGLSKIGDFFKPLISGAGELLTKAWPYVKSFAEQVGVYYKNLVAGVKPVIDAFGGLFHTLANNGFLTQFGNVLHGVGNAAIFVSKAFKPVGQAIGFVVDAFGKMHGGAQFATVAFATLLALGPKLAGGLRLVWNEMRNIGTGSGAVASGLSRVRSMLATGGVIAGAAFLFNQIGDAFADIKRNQDAVTSSTQDLTTALVANNGQWSTQIRNQQIASIAGTDQFKTLINAGANYNDTMDFLTGKTHNFSLILSEIKNPSLDVMNVVQWAQGMNQSGDAAQKAAQDQIAYGKAADASGAAAMKGSGGVSGMALANEAAAISALKLIPATKAAAAAVVQSSGLSLTSLSNIAHGVTGAAATAKEAAADSLDHAALLYQNFGAHVAGIHVQLDDKGVFQGFQTDTEKAFAAFKQATSDAGDAADLFWFKMAGPKATAQQAIYAAAAAMRAVAAAGRDQGSNADAVTSAQAGVKSAESKQTSSDYTSAQKIQDVAAARRTLAAALDTQAASQANLYSAEVEAGKAAAQQVEQTYEAIKATKGDTAARTAAVAKMAEMRKAFVDNYVAGKQSAMSDGEKKKSLAGLTAEAGKVADSFDLIPKHVNTIISSNNKDAIAKAAATDLANRQATQKRTAVLDAKIDAAKAKALELKKLGIDATVDRQGNLILQTAQAKADAEALATAAAAATANRSGTLTMQVIADTNAAQAAIDALKLPSYAPTLATEAASYQAAARPKSANGNIFSGTLQKWFGTGGEDHSANIYRGGPIRFFAEPETEGEGYIPLAKSKRRRSNDIMGALARRMGGHFISDAGKAYADGGMFLASGGVLPGSTALSLSGRTPATLGTSAANVAQALTDIATAVSDARAAADDKASKVPDLASKVRDATAKRTSDLAAAENKLADARAVQHAENAKTTARQRAIDAERISSAQLALVKIKATDNAAVDKATRELAAAKRVAAAYRTASDAASAYQRAAQAQFRAQQANAARMDSLTARLTTAQDNLTQIKSDRSSMASSVAGTVSGFDGGITGHSDTRTTFDTILQGQKYDMAQTQAFQANLAALRKKGLSNASLGAIANAGVDGGGVTAAALAKASPAQLKQLNGVTGMISNIGNAAGNSVAGAFYDVGVRAGEGLVKGFQSQIGALQKVMTKAAGVVVGTLKKDLQIHSPSKVMHDLGGHVATGFANGILGGYGGVASATSGMMSIPQIPASSHRQGASYSTPQFNVRVFVGNQEITDIARTEVEVGVAKLSQAALVAAGRPA